MLLVPALNRSGLADWVDVGKERPFGVFELYPKCDSGALRAQLMQTGQWVVDPLPSLRRRWKPWVRWSLRERKVGLALHLECEEDAIALHLDTFSPSVWWILTPLHLLVDLWGWRSLRMWLLRRRIKAVTASRKEIR